VPIDAAITDRWGLITAEAKRKGNSPAVIDSLLAATELHLNLTVVSRNATDFAGTQVQVLHPWVREIPRQAVSAFVEFGVPVMRRAPRLNVK
jgi:toxin FitB